MTQPGNERKDRDHASSRAGSVACLQGQTERSASPGARPNVVLFLLTLFLAGVPRSFASSASTHDLVLNVTSNERNLDLEPGGDSERFTLYLNITPYLPEGASGTAKLTCTIDRNQSDFSVSYSSSVSVPYRNQTSTKISVKARSSCPKGTYRMSIKADIAYSDGSRESVPP
jgi:hypothetical protein